ncbi:MAG: Fe-Mn family superoxide dismutase [Candidatus Paceibacteria bacterium]|jgi:Fe-Mn family superoxide dismutase
MKHYNEKTFDIPALKGISEKSVEEHLKLYSGYVKHTNLILDKIEELKDDEQNAYALSEMTRRFSFEFDGMRNHEYYFSSLSGGAQEFNSESQLGKKIVEDFGSFDAWLARFKTIAKTRGVGWAILYYDKQTDQLLSSWVDEQHLGQLSGLSPILTLDVWEHSFVADYQPSGKGQYIDDFFDNLNWKKVEENFDTAK